MWVGVAAAVATSRASPKSSKMSFTQSRRSWQPLGDSSDPGSRASPGAAMLSGHGSKEVMAALEVKMEISILIRDSLLPTENAAQAPEVLRPVLLESSLLRPRQKICHNPLKLRRSKGQERSPGLRAPSNELVSASHATLRRSHLRLQLARTCFSWPSHDEKAAGGVHRRTGAAKPGQPGTWDLGPGPWELRLEGLR